jgi:hypothetical protein
MLTKADTLKKNFDIIKKPETYWDFGSIERDYRYLALSHSVQHELKMQIGTSLFSWPLNLFSEAYLPGR